MISDEIQYQLSVCMSSMSRHNSSITCVICWFADLIVDACLLTVCVWNLYVAKQITCSLPSDVHRARVIKADIYYERCDWNISMHKYFANDLVLYRLQRYRQWWSPITTHHENQNIPKINCTPKTFSHARKAFAGLRCTRCACINCRRWNVDGYWTIKS